jgi:hypothetical protein
MDRIKPLIDRVLADKAASWMKARALAWPEKVATIERLRDATRLARKSMQASRPKPSMR